MNRVFLLVILFIVSVCLFGCGGEFATGVVTGAATSSASVKYQADLQKSKQALAAELQTTRAELFELQAAGETEKAKIVEDRLKKLEQKELAQDVGDFAAERTEKVLQTTDYKQWAFDGVLGLLLLLQKRKSNIDNRVMTEALAAAPPETAKVLAEKRKELNKRVIV